MFPLLNLKTKSYGNESKAVKKKAPKKRASTYEQPVKFTGTFDDMIAISTTGAGSKKKAETKK